MDRPIGLISRPLWRSGGSITTSLQTRTAMAFLLAVVLLTLVGWLYLDQAAAITAASADIGRLREHRTDMVRESRYLQAQIAEVESMHRVVTRARALGLHPPESITKLTVERQPAAGGVPAVQQPAHTASEQAWLEAQWWYTPVMQAEAWARQHSGEIELVARLGVIGRP